MADLASAYAGWKSGLMTVLILVAALCGLVFNILFIFVVIKSKYMRRPQNLFLLNIAVADLLAAIFWAVPAIAAASTWQWHLGDGYCKFHGFIAMLCFALNFYTFTVVAFEKFFRIVLPARHEEAFHNYTISFVVIGALWLLSFVVGIMPLIGWSSFKYYNYQMQCASNFDIAYTLLNFYMACVFMIPTIGSLVLYIILFIRVSATLKKDKNKTKDGKFVLQERKSAPGDSYAEKMKMQQAKFKVNKSSQSKKKKNKDKKNKNKKSEDDEGYDSDKCYQSGSSADEQSEEEFYDDYEDYRIKKRNQKIIRERKRVYVYKKQYLLMAITMLITMAIYIGLWLPYYIVTYTYLNDTTSVTEGSYIVFTVITFFGLSYKPLIYLTNSHVRISVLRAFRCKRKKKVVYGGEARDATVTETRTVREVHHTEEHVETTVKTRTYTEEKVEEPTSQPTLAWEDSDVL